MAAGTAKDNSRLASLGSPGDIMLYPLSVGLLFTICSGLR